MSAFIDSSVWFAAAAKRDGDNELAKSSLMSIDRPVTTALILAQTWQLLKANFGADVADKFWEKLRDSDAHIATVTEADLEAAWQIGTIFPDEEFSFADRTSFAVMERTGITSVAAFNPAFASYRYGSHKKAFQIIRAGHSAAFTAIREAILQRRPIQLSYGGRQQMVCPYILGHAVGEERAFALAVDASRRRKRPTEDKWVCLRLAKVDQVHFVDEPWTEQSYPGVVQRCVDQVHLDARRLTGDHL